MVQTIPNIQHITTHCNNYSNSQRKKQTTSQPVLLFYLVFLFVLFCYAFNSDYSFLHHFKRSFYYLTQLRAVIFHVIVFVFCFLFLFVFAILQLIAHIVCCRWWMCTQYVCVCVCMCLKDRAKVTNEMYKYNFNGIKWCK